VSRRTPNPFLTRVDSRKGFIAGTHRTRSPADTFDDYKRWMPAMGITRVANITGLDVIGLPVYTAIRPNARSLSTSQGKGIDDASAKTSALMESIEFWHAEHIDDARLRWDTYGRMRRRETTVDLQAVATRGTVATDVPLLWIEGFCLLTHEPTWVPFELVSQCDLAVGGVPTTPFGWSSTGLASGNHLLEAVAHALSEVIERHAEVSWARGERSVRIDPASISASASSGIAAAVLSMLQSAGVYSCIWDMTLSDIAIPAYVCDVIDAPDVGRRRLLGSYNGSGCHLSAEVALSRAITEAVQSRLTYIAGSRDDAFRAQYAATQDETVHRLQWEELQRDHAMRPFEPVSLATGTFGEDVERLLRALERGGAKQAIAVDLTREDMGIPVVKVIVPGMQELGAPGAEPEGGE
jgi:YcaO-like protein with predicted kinase domain